MDRLNPSTTPLPNEVSASPQGEPPADLRLKRILLGTLLACFLITLAFLLKEICGDNNTFLALYDQDRFFESDGGDLGQLEEKKTEFLRDLNVELNHDRIANGQEENRLLARLDRLWRSFKRYVSPSEGRKVRDSAETKVVVRFPGDLRWTQSLTGSGLGSKPGDALQSALALAKDTKAIERTALETARKKDPAGLDRLPHGDEIPKVPLLGGGLIDTEVLNNFFYNLEPRGGVRTRGVAWRVHPKLTVEGALDTTRVGQTDADLNDFGIRSVHALTFLRDEVNPGILMSGNSIDSGYPRSYSIGLNLRLSSAMKLLFDYSREFQSDYFIEYMGNWESSLMTDYSKNRPANPAGDGSIHNFFFGLNYLHRLGRTLVPMQTGFFYSTNMAGETIPSDVSMGFSVGGGYQRKEVGAGVSYRLRIWENPDQKLALNEMEVGEMSTRLSNQLLFYVNF